MRKFDLNVRRHTPIQKSPTSQWSCKDCGVWLAETEKAAIMGLQDRYNCPGEIPRVLFETEWTPSTRPGEFTQKEALTVRLVLYHKDGDTIWEWKTKDALGSVCWSNLEDDHHETPHLRYIIRELVRYMP